MLVHWDLRIVTAVATSSAICAATRVLCVAIRTRRVARTASWCHPVKNVAKLNEPLANKRPSAQVITYTSFFVLVESKTNYLYFLWSPGNSSECPASAPQPDGTECLEKGQCRNGTCLPFCETRNYKSCMCDTVANACKRCCRSSDTCFPFEPYYILPDGTPCVHGFCNSVSDLSKTYII